MGPARPGQCAGRLLRLDTEHIAAIARAVRSLPPRVQPAHQTATALAGLEPFVMAL